MKDSLTFEKIKENFLGLPPAFQGIGAGVTVVIIRDIITCLMSLVR